MAHIRNRKADTPDQFNPASSPELQQDDKLPRNRSDISDRLGGSLSAVVVLVFTAGTAYDHGYLPPLLVQVLAVAGLVCLGYKLVTFKRWGDENRHVLLFLLCAATMLLTMLVFDNFMVWVVSQTDRMKLQLQPGLQDNVELAVVALEAGKGGAWVTWALRSRWAHIMHFLAALLALAFSSVFDQIPYSGFGLMARVVLTHGICRVLRVACFMSTVLPSPRPGCFLRRFKGQVAHTWPEFWRMGLAPPRGSGGCNDLLFSGHCSFWVMAPLAFQAYYPKPLPIALLWLALIQTSIRDVIEYQHYAVDMIVAVVCSWAVWNSMEWVYPPSRPLPRRPHNSPPDKVSPLVLTFVVVLLAAPCLLVVVSGA